MLIEGGLTAATVATTVETVAKVAETAGALAIQTAETLAEKAALDVVEKTSETVAKMAVEVGTDAVKDMVKEVGSDAINYMANEVGPKVIESVKDSVDKKIHDMPQEVGAKAADKISENLVRDGEDSLSKTFESSDCSEEKMERFVDKWENGKELTSEQKVGLQEKLGWSEKKINDKCRIDDKGTIQYKTDRCDLEGKKHENCGVPYERKTININGVGVEGVFPIFDSLFDVQLPLDKYKSTRYADICNAKLGEAIKTDPDLAAKFSKEQIKEISNGQTPSGFNWNHNEEPGKMQLVRAEKHDKTIGGAPHTGGSTLWGPDSVVKTVKGGYV